MIPNLSVDSKNSLLTTTSGSTQLVQFDVIASDPTTGIFGEHAIHGLAAPPPVYVSVSQTIYVPCMPCEDETLFAVEEHGSAAHNNNE